MSCATMTGSTEAPVSVPARSSMYVAIVEYTDTTLPLRGPKLEKLRADRAIHLGRAAHLR